MQVYPSQLYYLPLNDQILNYMIQIVILMILIVNKHTPCYKPFFTNKTESGKYYSISISFDGMRYYDSKNGANSNDTRIHVHNSLGTWRIIFFLVIIKCERCNR